MRYLIFAVSIIFLVFVSACTSSGTAQVTIQSDIPITVNAEIADDPQERAMGLMNRASLPAGQGMLFVFDDSAPRSFWMKDTLISLDIIFISADFEIVDITTMEPCKTLICSSYVSNGSAQYVLEVNAGFADEHGIEKGNKVVVRF